MSATTPHPIGSGHLTPPRLPAALDPTNATDVARQFHVLGPDEPHSLIDILAAEGHLNTVDARSLELRQATPGTLRELLSGHLDVPDEALQRAFARSLRVPFVDPVGFEVESTAIAAVPAAFARSHTLMPLCFVPRGGLVVASEDPTDPLLNEALALSIDHPVELVVATRDGIERAITRWYGPQEDREALDQIDGFSPADADPETAAVDLMALGREKPVIRLVHNILLDAVRQGASDVHLRPLEHQVDLLFRIDGALIKMRTFRKSMLRAVVSRIKIISNMNVAEHRVPQDGRFRMSREGNDIDMRLSIIPTVQGESAVIRILDGDKGLKSIDDLGFSPGDATRFAELMTRNAGMVLVTGPTGCGKSTTLYAALQEVQRSGVHIVTVEDPVEYRLAGVNQIQVNNVTGLTFPRTLRHILRHDPDVIMVGEIRDRETAVMAVESSLTGHLVLSTLHTNSAAGAVTRFLEIGVEPYLLKSSLMAVLAQRLVRRNCPGCAAPETVDPQICQALGVTGDEGFVRGRGCGHCHQTGYHGRRAVYELLMVTDPVRELIRDGASSQDIERCAIQEGMQTLLHNAVELARSGETSLAEAYRVRLTV